MTSPFTVLHNKLPFDTVETVVAMAVYHGDTPLWVEEAISSITSQTYTSFAFVIVIDGDIPVVLANKLKDLAFLDSRIVLLLNEENQGLAASMNNVVTWVTPLSPDYFVRMDADDISVPHRLSRQISYLRKHANIAVLGSALTEVNENGQSVGARVMPASHKQIVKVLARRCGLNHPTVVIRFMVFQKGFTYDPRLMNTQDYFLWVTLASNGFIFRNLKDRLLKFRRVNNFYKRRGLSKSINEFRARLFAMVKLRQFSAYNLFYACSVLLLRLMPGKIVKLAYKLDRLLLDRFGKH